ncbi:hypothetical protein BRAS3809_7240001 [Bradyrhizobium sp. STM 3809]|nr:hypothetical protein BRAS3809_7240001 [Bradyrhizobium sp. STM 3809]
MLVERMEKGRFDLGLERRSKLFPLTLRSPPQAGVSKGEAPAWPHGSRRVARATLLTMRSKHRARRCR